MVVSEIVVKEVPVGQRFFISTAELAVDREHGHKVARVLTISKEFKTESWNEGLVFGWLDCR